MVRLRAVTCGTSRKPPLRSGTSNPVMPEKLATPGGVGVQQDLVWRRNRRQEGQRADSNFSLVRSRLFPETAILGRECAAAARHIANAPAADAAFALRPSFNSAAIPVYYQDKLLVKKMQQPALIELRPSLIGARLVVG